MSMSFEHEMRKGYLYIKVSGVFSLSEACQQFRKAVRVVEECGTDKVLVDCLQLGGKPNTVDYYSYGVFVSEELTKHASVGKVRRPQMAYVAAMPLLDSGRLAELTATNRGAVMKSTDSMKEALDWLKIPVEERPQANAP